jgi:hypothetical protein
LAGQTQVEIRGEDFLINGRPTYPGREWRGHRIEGLLLNARMVNATFDDVNPETRDWWAYPDTGRWDPERNVREFLEMLPEYRHHGLLAVTINFQGGSPEGYSRPSPEKERVRGSREGGGFSATQPWENSGFTPTGDLRAEYADRVTRVIERADELGMVVIVGYFYQGQDERLADERAVVRGVDAATAWLLEGGWTNVIVEIGNESDVPKYEHAILRPGRVHELIARVKGTTSGGRRLLVSTSFRGGTIPGEDVLGVADLALLHGNGVTDPAVMAWLVERTRHRMATRPMPIVVNEDDHFDFEKDLNNCLAAISRYASWGFFDAGPGSGGGGARGNYMDGYQLVPVNWSINTPTKRGFFQLVREVTSGV